MDTYDLLTNKGSSYLIFERVESSDIVIGVPHHVPRGGKMRTEKKRPSDQNAGMLGYLVAQELNCSFVCAGNYFIDPNKSLASDYSMAIRSCKPKYLVEIHGHGKTKTQTDIEISCGSSAREPSAMELKNALNRQIQSLGEGEPGFEELSSLTIDAVFSRIYFKATGTDTITTDKWLPFHLELAPILRKAEDGGLPEPGKIFASLLVKALSEMCV